MTLKSIHYRLGILLIGIADYVFWKLFPTAYWDYVHDIAGQLDDYVHIDSIGDYLSDGRDR